MNNLTKLEAWVARWLFRRVVKQGYHHLDRTQAVLGILGEEWGREFYEDNRPTHMADLTELLYRAVFGAAPEVTP